MEQESRGTFTNFVREMREFTESEREFLSIVLDSVGGTKGAIVSRLNEAYFDEYGQRLN